MKKKIIEAILFFCIGVFTLTINSACSGSAGAQDTQQTNEHNSEELTNRFLDIALKKDFDSINKLVKDGFDPNKLLYGRESFAILFIVDNHYKYYHKDLVAALINNGANINLTNKTPTSALYNAVGNLDKTAVKDLLDLGADPRLIVAHETPLHLLVRNYDRLPLSFTDTTKTDILDMLLSHPKIDLRAKDKSSHEPLYYAYYSQMGDRYGTPVTEVINKFAAKGITFTP
jgi:hypothetical protein